MATTAVEALQGSAGCIPGHPEFLAALGRHCDKSAALLIFDEVMTSHSTFVRHGLPMCVTGAGSLMDVHGVSGPVASVDDLHIADDVHAFVAFVDQWAATMTSRV